MSFEHGSLDLGIRNPFRFEGTLRAIRGGITALLGLLSLLNVASAVQTHPITGWTFALIGFVLMANGLWTLGRGLMQVMRFYVGRSAPTSLSFNHAKSEQDSANRERQDVAYDQQQIESMLVGSKNYTFKEPVGLVARLLHTLFPKITFVPYPIQNLAQRVVGALVQTLVALFGFAILSFVTSVGLAGDKATILMPFFAFTLLCYVALVWFRAGRPLNRRLGRGIETVSAFGFVKMVAVCVSVPVIINIILGKIFSYELEKYQEVIAAQLRGLEIEAELNEGMVWATQMLDLAYNSYSNATWLGLIFVFAIISCGLVLGLTALRAKQANPTTEITDKLPRTSEVGARPMDIFNEFNHQVMERRRYKKVPNRIYKPLSARQNPNNGEFDGELIQETQPKTVEKTDEPVSKKMRIASTSLAQALLMIATLLVFYALTPLTTYTSFYDGVVFDLLDDQTGPAFVQTSIESFFTVLSLLVAASICAIFGRLLSNLSHPFWSEIQFESSLVYFKCKGTVKEDTRTFGKGFNDSTSLETSVFTSTIQPRLFVTRVISSTFAGIGNTNLMFPRHIMTMHGDENLADELHHELMHSIGNRAGTAAMNDEQRKVVEEYNSSNLEMKAKSAPERLANRSSEQSLSAPEDHVTFSQRKESEYEPEATTEN
ncbi:hypothetical protein M0C34_19730 [Agarivorans sp. TSD2052]|uniref:hypothetical protein n=1 Tax=Agarivorans sp. TSD2052 TaxID=2937286 RepID=UPI002010639D|nr:hypothetical protein [Agarivorans sp. TSD2052]UPW18427.1 hypothetical protein M0C34_19730 [Agarivorans sp. TSD2052]